MPRTPPCRVRPLRRAPDFLRSHTVSAGKGVFRPRNPLFLVLFLGDGGGPFTILRPERPPFAFLRSHAVSAGFWGVHSQACSATRTPNSRDHSYVHYSLSNFTGEWFTNHSNHIHRFTPITRMVANKLARL